MFMRPTLLLANECIINAIYYWRVCIKMKHVQIKFYKKHFYETNISS